MFSGYCAYHKVLMFSGYCAYHKVFTENNLIWATHYPVVLFIFNSLVHTNTTPQHHTFVYYYYYYHRHHHHHLLYVVYLCLYSWDKLCP